MAKTEFSRWDNEVRLLRPKQREADLDALIAEFGGKKRGGGRKKKSKKSASGRGGGTVTVTGMPRQRKGGHKHNMGCLYAKGKGKVGCVYDDGKVKGGLHAPHRALRESCEKCGLRHSTSEHSSHGRGSFARTHDMDVYDFRTGKTSE
jgi:hypothetical protein